MNIPVELEVGGVSTPLSTEKVYGEVPFVTTISIEPLSSPQVVSSVGVLIKFGDEDERT